MVDFLRGFQSGAGMLGNMESTQTTAMANRLAREKMKREGAMAPSGDALASMQDAGSIQLNTDANGKISYSVTEDFYTNMDQWTDGTMDVIFGENLKRYITKDEDGPGITYARNQRIGVPVVAKPDANGFYPVPDVLLAKLEANPDSPQLKMEVEEYKSGKRKVIGIPTINKKGRMAFLTKNRTDDPTDSIAWLDGPTFARFVQGRLTDLHQKSDPESFAENSKMKFIGGNLTEFTSRTDAISQTDDVINNLVNDRTISPTDGAQAVVLAANSGVRDLDPELVKKLDTPPEATPPDATPPADTTGPRSATAAIDDTPPDDTPPDHRPAVWMGSDTRAQDVKNISDLKNKLSYEEQEIKRILGTRTKNFKASGMDAKFQPYIPDYSYEDEADREKLASLQKTMPKTRAELAQLTAKITKLDTIAKSDTRTDSRGYPTGTTYDSRGNAIPIDSINTNDPNSSILTKRGITTNSQVAAGITNGSIAEINLTPEETDAIATDLKDKGVKTMEDAKEKVRTGEVEATIAAMGMVNALTGSDGKVYGMTKPEALNYFYNLLTQGMPSSQDPLTVEAQTYGIQKQAYAQSATERTMDQADRQMDQVDAANAAKAMFNFQKIQQEQREWMQDFTDNKIKEYDKINEFFDPAAKWSQRPLTKEGDNYVVDSEAYAGYQNYVNGYDGLATALRVRAGSDYARMGQHYNDAMSDLVASSDGLASIFKFDEDVFMMLSDQSIMEHNTLVKNRVELAYMNAERSLRGSRFNIFSGEWWKDWPRPDAPDWDHTKAMKQRIAVKTGKDGLPTKIVALKIGHNGRFIEAEESIPYNELRNRIDAKDLKIILNNAPIIGQGGGPDGMTAEWINSQPSLINHIQAISQGPQG